MLGIIKKKKKLVKGDSNGSRKLCNSLTDSTHQTKMPDGASESPFFPVGPACTEVEGNMLKFCASYKEKL